MIKIRAINSSEIIHLSNFLYDAIYVSEGFEKPGKDIVKRPELSRYIRDFGKDSDVCLVAELNGKLTGAIWTRIFNETEKGFGYVDSDTPELSMSVIEQYRNTGIGTKLLSAMIDKLRQLNYTRVSLSVDRNNYAYRLYKKFGFKTVNLDEKSAIMIKWFK